MENEKKKGRYERILKQIEELLLKSDNDIAHMATISAVLYHKMEYFFWCGFYRLIDGELIVGPYQGPVACQILKKNTGVCWAGINEKKTIVVPDVEKFPGHIACDSRSKSEIVVPVKNKSGNIIGVLDVDSSELISFDEIDAKYLEKIISLLK
ncbi:MAG TPA: GAF domain-containing protein [Bacteroidales bacterium]|nr:GAF domain-containing protein [Bacteroidales bacterium]HPS15771.1 GAF domain-containing protein [Bacteroidales bacterium]